MTPPDIALACFDINGTLATIAGMSHVAGVAAMSPLPDREVRRILEDDFALNTTRDADAFTSDVVARACAALRISGSNWPFGVVRMSPYELKPRALEAIQILNPHIPVVTLSNTSAFALNDGAHGQIARQLAKLVAGAYYSCRIEAAKPDPQTFLHVVHAHGVAPEQLVHIGDSWHNDIQPVLGLGGYAAWVNPHREPVPELGLGEWERLIVAPDVLSAAQRVLRDWVDPIRRPSERLTRALNEAGDTLKRTLMVTVPKPTIIGDDEARWEGEGWRVEWRRDHLASLWDNQTDARGYALALLAADQRRAAWLPAAGHGSRSGTQAR